MTEAEKKFSIPDVTSTVCQKIIETYGHLPKHPMGYPEYPTERYIARQLDEAKKEAIRNGGNWPRLRPVGGLSVGFDQTQIEAILYQFLKFAAGNGIRGERLRYVHINRRIIKKTEEYLFGFAATPPNTKG